MTTAELVTRVMLTGLVVAALLAAPAWWLGGPGAALGVLAGAAIVLVDFRWLTRDAERMLARVAAGGPGAPRLATLGLRRLAIFGVLGLLIASGVSHPLAVIAGLVVLPPLLVVHGLRGARAPDHITG
ncbi:MAG: ATP synthase subunit I [Candidatus Rokubacteria bacterium]|nr:ATP synthase subunit I [Candidatus Rokubacteria bacterium]